MREAALVFILTLLAQLAALIAKAEAVSEIVRKTQHVNKVVSMRSDCSATRQVFRLTNPARSCAEDSNVPDGSTKLVSFSSSQLCRKIDWWPDQTERTRGSYSISKVGGQMQIGLKIFLNYRGSEKNRPQVLRRLAIARGCVQNFYQHFGVRLKLEFDVNSGWSKWWNSNVAINLWDSIERSDSGNWGMLHRQGIPMNDELACGMLSHEIGHLLGLNDRYVEDRCPDRTIGPPDDIMRNGGWNGLDDARFYPDQIRQILEPLCG